MQSVAVCSPSAGSALFIHTFLPAVYHFLLLLKDIELDMTLKSVLHFNIHFGFIFMLLSGLTTFIHVCHEPPADARKGHWILRTGVPDGCELAYE